MWADEIALFADEVQRITGRELTAEALGEAITLINRKRRALAQADAPAYDRIVEVERAFDAHRDRYC